MRLPILRAFAVNLLLILGLHADIAPVIDIWCETTYGLYPVTIEWTNDDPGLEYTEHRIIRDGEVIATLDGGTDDSYTVVDGPYGATTFTVQVYSSSLDCTADALETCFVVLGEWKSCAVDSGFEGQDYVADDTYEFTLVPPSRSWRSDGTTDDDLSPKEDCRADITDVFVELCFTAEAADSFTWTLTSPEGTALVLLDGSGGPVELQSGDCLVVADFGADQPDAFPEGCSVDDCRYLPSGPGSFADFYDEDGHGDWTLEGTTTDEGALEDWCLGVTVDEYSESGNTYLRGDVNGDGSVTALSDALYLLAWNYADGTDPPCFEAADVDGNGAVSALIDALRLLQHAFGDASVPPPPFPLCGRADPGYEYTGVEVPCETPTYCGPCD